MTDAAQDRSRILADHRERICRYIRGIIRDSTEAEDLAQETLLRAHRGLAALDDPAKVGPWLYRIATNLCYDRFRRRSNRDRPHARAARSEGVIDASGVEDVAATHPRPDRPLEQDEMSACVQAYLADLPDTYRAVILLHDMKGMTNPDIAAMLGVSLATVKIRLHRAREKLRKSLADGCSLTRDDRGVIVCDPTPDDAARRAGD